MLCEKPVMISEEQVKKVTKIAEENNMVFMVAMKTRFLPINQKIKKWINEGRICVPTFSNADTAIILINGKEEKIHLPFKINGFEYQIQEVVRGLREGKIQSDIMSWKDSMEIMTIMDSIKNNGNKSFYIV